MMKLKYKDLGTHGYTTSKCQDKDFNKILYLINVCFNTAPQKSFPKLIYT